MLINGEMTMSYWKLGCNWGRGKPDFYSLLKEKRIVICGDHSMAKDDWVLICQGHDAAALAKIGSAPVPSTARADLREGFERLQITYDETNSVADAAKFYELTDPERFQYQLQQGICRINNPEIRRTIERILTAREGNKMITQATKLLKSKKNIILQGAPGTGKTYATAALALSVLGVTDVNFNDHAAVMRKYEELRGQKRIFFTTFHQSMDYEAGRSEEDLLRLGSGFGSGMGTMEGTCGALVGAIMVSSLLSEKGAAMAASRAIMPRFKELCGATICRDLKGIDTGKVLCSCENCVRNAVRAAGESLAKD